MEGHEEYGGYDPSSEESEMDHEKGGEIIDLVDAASQIEEGRIIDDAPSTNVDEEVRAA